MADTPTGYTSVADIKKFWIENIAPNYFDFENVNNYTAGLFGYINEVMGNSVEDAFHAITTARREFYPVTAEYMSSLYKMATLQRVDIPLTVPAHCKALLVLQEKEVIANSTVENGVYTCVLDSCMKIFADSIQFMLDYPVVILSKKTNTGWSHTVHYDINVKNTLANKNTNRYLANKVMRNNGTDYLILFIDTIRQVEMSIVSQVVIKDSLISTTSMEIDYDGNLANFEVFYMANQNSPRIQLEKVLINGIIPNKPFCYYEFISNGKIRLTFPANTSFVPEFNSEIEVHIYTSSGSYGNFEKFDGDLICTSDSDDYPYNANMTIVGQINGASTGGQDQMLNEDFRTAVLRGYATNHTITTSNDLQLRFDEIASGIQDTKVLFRKKRDDAFTRLFGAYVLMRDTLGNIIPTNTLDLNLQKSDIMDVESTDMRVMIKPGQKFVYENPSPSSMNFKCDLWDRLEYGSDTPYMFTNPFLIGINLRPAAVGYYLNSLDSVATIEYTYMNDDTENQFIAVNLTLYRNAIIGNGFYKFTLKMTPANSDLDITTIATANPPESNTDSETGETTDINCIRAKNNGIVLSQEFTEEAIPGSTDETTGKCWLKTTLEYADKSTQVIVSSNNLNEDPEYRTGYKMLYNTGESFTRGDIVAVKLATDTGRLRVLSDINHLLMTEGMYIPWFVEEVNEDENYVIVAAYLSTDDMIDVNSNIEIDNGIYRADGSHNQHVAIPMRNLSFELHSFFRNDDYNPPHNYGIIEYVSDYTHTNTYISSDDTPLAFIEPMNFIRSTATFIDLQTYKGEEIPADLEIGDNGHTGIEIKIIDKTEEPRDENVRTYRVIVSGQMIRSRLTDILEFPGVPIDDAGVIDLKFDFPEGVIDDSKLYHVTELNPALEPYKKTIKGIVRGKNGIACRDMIIQGSKLHSYEFLLGVEDVVIDVWETEGPPIDDTLYLVYIDEVFQYVRGNTDPLPAVIDERDGEPLEPGRLTAEDAGIPIIYIAQDEVISVEGPPDFPLQVHLLEDGDPIPELPPPQEYKPTTPSEPGGEGGGDDDLEGVPQDTYTDTKEVFYLTVAANILYNTGEGAYVPPKVLSEVDYGIELSRSPLISYEWAYKVDNYALFINRMRLIDAQLEEAFIELENNFSIDMKFYNTYGKSQFYTVGLETATTKLDNVSCSFKFGIKTRVLSNKDEFIERVQKYIKDYIEDFDNLTGATSTQNIYILNLIQSVENEFSEIEYMIYYGFNRYDHEAQKIIGPELESIYTEYIPEFLNINLLYDTSGVPHPDINLVQLES